MPGAGAGRDEEGVVACGSCHGEGNFGGEVRNPDFAGVGDGNPRRVPYSYVSSSSLMYPLLLYDMAMFPAHPPHLLDDYDGHGDFGNVAVYDAEGESGVEDDVNRHQYLRTRPQALGLTRVRGRT